VIFVKGKRVYTTFGVLSIAGYLWIGYTLISVNFTGLPQPFCVFKAVTAVPCPTCGSTHAVQALLTGDVLKSVFINPFGLLSTLFLLIIPLWIMYDFLLGKSGLYDAYGIVESQLKKRKIIIMVIALGCLNWLWNIYKIV